MTDEIQKDIRQGKTSGKYAKNVFVDNDEANPIPTYLVTDSPSSETISSYNEITALSSGSETDIVTYTVPIGVDFFLQNASVSGTNIAIYRLKIDGVTRDKKVTWFNGPMSETFDFNAGSERGLRLSTGTQIVVSVIHSRPMVGDFNARIQGVEQDLL